ncbi:ThuA domain-containing protein [Chitinophaga nivalis]|uniref:ThuA domain-containing protein n=1 Tax=Chitinophaga nivalis TaxID=2991709 RepID=A0ABT3ITX0_9BACT|nr:ThuA domain-containing protein [Chitinophaga nivalis]MCW3462940.1 ThuA domain-containing protein [Chitinophaga nivalis]MCW3487370.1 ThuA domain-containing protein [Chitinophaga nivalis]
MIKIILALLLSGVLYAQAAPVPPTKKILVFSKTTGFRHDCIPTAKQAIMQLGATHGFAVDTTEDASVFTTANLQQYAAVIFSCTTGDVLNDAQQTAFQAYIRQGGGFVGIHAATDTEYDWPWYNRLVGAWFLSHPRQQTATLLVTDTAHPATRHLPANWVRKDEWYNFKDLNPDVTVLIKIDESSYEGGQNGDYHPMCWYHAFEGGRAFYTAMGHTIASYQDPLYLQHLLGGIQYAIGNWHPKKTSLP